jgi:hypothetical protein
MRILSGKKLISIKKLTAIILIVVTVGSLYGCGSKENGLQAKSKAELIKMIEKVNKQYEKKSKEYESLFNLYNGVISEESASSAIGSTGDGTDRLTFNSIKQKIIFTESLQYPKSTTAISDGNVTIAKDVTCNPGANWVCKLGSATLELEHYSGITGTIKIGTQGFVYEADKIKNDVLGEWFKSLPQSAITYTNIAIDGTNTGSQAVSKTLINGADAYIRVGMAAIGDICVTYAFVYNGEKDGTKDEVITNLLNTISLAGSKVIVEQ